MDFNRYPIPTSHTFNRYPVHFNPAMIVRSSRFYNPLPYPYTWCTYRNQTFIVNVIDLHNNYEQIEQPMYETYHHIYPYGPYAEYDDDVLILNNFDHETEHHNSGYQYQYHQINRNIQVETNDEVLMIDSFDHETEHYNGGLNKNVISENLKISIYSDDGEEGEVCVVCQVEFETSERLGVLECNHRYHPTCIEEWLMRVCPVCKAQALMV